MTVFVFCCDTKHSDTLWEFIRVHCYLLLHVRCWVVVVKNGHFLLDFRTLKSFIYIYIYIYNNCKVTCTEEATEMAAKYLLNKKMCF